MVRATIATAFATMVLSSPGMLTASGNEQGQVQSVHLAACNDSKKERPADLVSDLATIVLAPTLRFFYQGKNLLKFSGITVLRTSNLGKLKQYSYAFLLSSATDLNAALL